MLKDRERRTKNEISKKLEHVIDSRAPMSASHPNFISNFHQQRTRLSFHHDYSIHYLSCLHLARVTKLDSTRLALRRGPSRPRFDNIHRNTFTVFSPAFHLSRTRFIFIPMGNVLRLWFRDIQARDIWDDEDMNIA